ncbi:hypothetical protein ADIS_0605 [Lunatimonas lonarensis]|uniref:Uncharacterized protein n=1 Tax=Lunatimonas lonarensis TaxID=1232681 RepID=R7ZXH1_9BACT|nr:hypothetical protein ADIS_0605 [Lunatimonas lonarensis]
MVAMSIGLFSSFDAEADGGCQFVCCARNYTIFCEDKDGNAWEKSKKIDGVTTCTCHEWD